MKKKTGGAVCRYCQDDSRVPNGAHMLAAGTLLEGRYYIGRPLGQGGFGIIYAGWDTYMDSRVVVKEYFPSGVAFRNGAVSAEVGAGDAAGRFEKHREHFVREYQVLAGLSDLTGIVQVKDFFSENNTAYIVMEYVEGITLKQYVKDRGGSLSTEETLGILKPVMRSLVKVHEAGLVHRDISPDNLMIQPDGKAKLLDFGAARSIGTDAAADRPLTKSTESVWKQGYTPLEQYQSRGGIGSWTDVYAFCATVWYCLTGAAPPDALERLLQDTPLRLPENGADVPAHAEDVLRRGMELRAGDRIPDMRQLSQALLEKDALFEKDVSFEKDTSAADEKTGKETAGASDPAMRKSRKKRYPEMPKMRLIPAACAAVLLSAIMAFTYRNAQMGVDKAVDKAIQAPICFTGITEEMDRWHDYGTWISVNCGGVSAFSNAYTYDCNLYIPKAACRDDGASVCVRWWLDFIDDDDVCFGTTDSVYEWNLIHQYDEVFPAVTDSRDPGRILEKSEYADIFQVREEGNFYKLEVRNLPYEDRMHFGEPLRYTQIDTKRGGTIAVNVKVTGLNQQLSSVVYLDDIAVKENGAVIKSMDCSAESLYGYSYHYEYDSGDGEKILVNNPQPAGKEAAESEVDADDAE